MSGTTGPNAGMTGVEDMAKDFWATRPRRPRRGRKIAGVAAGIANRYRIDPTLVRVGLVVAAIYGGAGVLVYLLGWLFMPEQDDEVSPFESMIGRGRSSTSTVFTLMLCLAFIPTMSWFFNGFAPGWLGLMVIAGVLYLLHRGRGHLPPEPTEQATGMPMPEMPLPTMPVPPTPPTPPTMATSAGPASGVTQPLPEETPVEPEREVRNTPPAWDPLGAAPFAWDLPDPNPPVDDQEPEPPVRRRKSRIGLVTVGIALIAVAGMSMGMGGWVDPQHIVGVVLAVLGLGMVFGSFVRGGRGLIGLAVPLSVIGIGMTAVAPQGWNGIGDIDVRPTTLEQVSSEYSRSVGSIEVDLSELSEVNRELDVEIDLGMGDVTVILPETADVDLTCKTDVGAMSCLDQVRDGVNNERLEVVDNGTDGRGGLEVDMRIDVGTGSLDVRRG